MAEWDFLLCSQILKEKQEKMQLCFSKITDALNGIREEAAYLRGIWKGEAGENFMEAFGNVWKEAKEAADEMEYLIVACSQIEEIFECVENEISGMDY